jgi:Ca2+-binding EF-hand superfamily protein
MMKKILFALSLVIILSFSFSQALAQDDAAKKIFAEIDTDKDGKVSKQEYMDWHMKFATKIREDRFKKLDLNGDGKITKDEFMDVQLKEAEFIGKLKFRRIDQNRDGVISEEEAIERYKVLKQSMERRKAQ